MLTKRFIALFLGLSLAACGGGGATGGATDDGGDDGGAPGVFRIELPDLQGHQFAVDEQIDFTVRAIDPAGGTVELTLANPPPGCGCAPATGTGEASTSFQWRIGLNALPQTRLVFAARTTGEAPIVAALSFDIIGTLESPPGMICCEVTGDGIPDLVCAAPFADIGGIEDQGAVYVFAGGSIDDSTPTARLVVTDVASPLLESLHLGNLGLTCCDVNADGIDDILAVGISNVAGISSAMSQTLGGVYVWLGGPAITGNVVRHAHLTAPIGQFGNWSHLTSPGIVCCDVTGDNINDVVVGSFLSDNGQVEDEGAVFVWAGSASLQGERAPTARLAGTDGLGGSPYQGLYCCDITGDGIRDIIVSNSGYDGAENNSGAIQVWRGGATLIGLPSPSATCSLGDDATALAFMGDQIIRCCDVTGDGINDLVTVASVEDGGGVVDAGMGLVFAGSPTLSGAVLPIARLVAPNPTVQGNLGQISHYGPAIVCCDVSGDGTDDVIIRAPKKNSQRGAVFVWTGGPTLQGTPATRAVLQANAEPFEEFSTEGICCADVNGDQINDIVVTSWRFDSFVGGIHLFCGGATMTGTPTASRLTVSGAQVNDGWGNEGVRCYDVTGDGIRDVIAASSTATANGQASAGGLAIWQGGATLGTQPTTTESAKLVRPVPFAGDLLANNHGWWLADVSGDGIADVIAASAYMDLTATDSGGVLAWLGGPTMTGTPTAKILGAIAVDGDQMGSILGVPDVPVQFADVTGDGVLDVIARARGADITPNADTGAVYVFAGGNTLANSVGVYLPAVSLFDTRQGDHQTPLMGTASRQGLFCHDMTQDGILDLLIGVPGFSKIGGDADLGAVFVYEGGPLLDNAPGIWANLNGAPGDRMTDSLDD